MQNIRINFQDNSSITAEFEVYDSADLTAKLNDQKISVFVLGNMVLSKSNVMSIHPVDPDPSANILVTLNNGSTLSAYSETYNANDVATKINDQRILMVSIGDVITNKNAVKMIAPIQ